MIQFAHPGLLWLFTVFIPLIAWYIWKRRNAYPSLGFSTLAPFKNLATPWRVYGLHFLFVLRLACLGCLIIMLARPQTHDSWSSADVEGTDIILAIDISGSMLARDFDPDRLQAAKSVASRFVAGRENDNIGLVVFAGESLTALPMTNDRSILTNYINSIEMGMIDDGTAIGEGLATSINRIKDSKTKSKSIILLTDGSNNAGSVSPLTAAEIAKQKDIRVYTIGLGTNGMAEVPDYYDPFGRLHYSRQPVVIDEVTLKQIAQITGGKYFRATDNNVLSAIFREIDSLEKSQIDVRSFTHTEDHYETWAFLALALLLFEMLLRNTVFRKIP